MKNKISCICK